MINELDVGLVELVLTAGWYLWWERRQIVHEEMVQTPARTAMSIAALTKNYQIATKKSSKLRQGWKKPSEGRVMVNVDAAFDEDGGRGSMGSIIRDSNESFIAAAHSYVPHLIDAPMAEAYALKEGLMLAQQIGCNRLIVQSDCMEVVQIMSDSGFTANSAAPIYDECNLVWSGFQEISIEHCHREANQAAHLLASRAMQTKQKCVFDSIQEVNQETLILLAPYLLLHRICNQPITCNDSILESWTIINLNTRCWILM